jgi:hypothetical protein
MSLPFADELNAAGFGITDLDVFYENGSPPFVGALSLGIARAE